MAIKVEKKDERSFPQNTKLNQSKTRLIHYTRRIIRIGIHNITLKPKSIPLKVMHPI